MFTFDLHDESPQEQQVRERRAMADYLLANEPRHRTDLALVTVSRDPQALNDLVAGLWQAGLSDKRAAFLVCKPVQDFVGWIVNHPSRVSPESGPVCRSWQVKSHLLDGHTITSLDRNRVPVRECLQLDVKAERDETRPDWHDLPVFADPGNVAVVYTRCPGMPAGHSMATVWQQAHVTEHETFFQMRWLCSPPSRWAFSTVPDKVDLFTEWPHGEEFHGSQSVDHIIVTFHH